MKGIIIVPLFGVLAFVNCQDFFDQLRNVYQNNPVTNFVTGIRNRFSGPESIFGGRSFDSVPGLGRGSITNRLFNDAPIIGSCDRIAYQGIANCMTNFRPSQISSKGQCCAWRKYRACVNGIRDGIKIAARTQSCPSRSFSRSTIQSLSDRLAGFPVSQCPPNSCPKRRSG